MALKEYIICCLSANREHDYEELLAEHNIVTLCRIVSIIVCNCDSIFLFALFTTPYTFQLSTCVMHPMPLLNLYMLTCLARLQLCS